MGTIITAFFSEDGLPKTGLSPLLSCWEPDGTVVLNGVAMTAVASGYYIYDFGSPYTPAKDFLFLADSVTLTGNDRYVYATNEIDAISVGGGGVGDVYVTGKKSPWTVKQRDSLIKVGKETKSILNKVSKTIDKYHTEDSSKLKEIKNKINNLFTAIGVISTNLKSNGGSKLMLDKIDVVLTTLDWHKSRLDIVSSKEDIKEINDDIEILAMSIFSMLSDESCDTINQILCDRELPQAELPQAESDQDKVEEEY